MACAALASGSYLFLQEKEQNKTKQRDTPHIDLPKLITAELLTLEGQLPDTAEKRVTC